MHVPFDEWPRLERACAERGADLAPVVLEPVIESSLRSGIGARPSAMHQVAPVLVFDEIKTGFRLRTAGLSGVFGAYNRISPR